MIKKTLLSIGLAGILTFTALPVYADTQDDINAAYERIGILEGQKQELENYLANLNTEYNDLSISVEELSALADEKSEELRQVNIELQRAKLARMEQYEKLKQYFNYENAQDENSWIREMLSSKSITEFVEKAEMLVQVTENDRQALAQYDDTMNQITEQQRKVAEEKEEIDKLYTAGNEKMEQLLGMVSSTEENIDSYAQEIVNNQDEAEEMLLQIITEEKQNNQASEEALTEEDTAAAEEEDSYALSEDAVQAAGSGEEEAGNYYDGMSDQYTYENDSAQENQEESDEVYSSDYNQEEDTLENNSSVVITDSEYDGNGNDTSASWEGDEEIEEPEYTEPEYEEPDYIDTDEYDEMDYTESEIDEPEYEELSYDDSVDEDDTVTGTDTSQGTYLGNFTLTAYCGCASCCGVAGQPTASGVMPVQGRTVAMGGVPFGTQLLINGYVYTVEDLGTPYGHVDIFFDSHEAALNFGRQSADVYQLN